MADALPVWLSAIPGAGHAGLAVARLAAGGQVTQAMLGKGGFALSSAAFSDGEELDPSFTADEEDAVAPPLEWTAPPPGTAELALVVECPQAKGKDGLPFCHWLVWGLPGQRGKLLEGEVPPRVGKNTFGNSEWLLPAPPAGGPPHDYLFQLFALDLPLVLMPGATREDLLSAMAGHITAVALLRGTYASQVDDDLAWDEDDD